MFVAPADSPVALPRWLWFARLTPSGQPGDGEAYAANVRRFEGFFQQYERQITAYLCRMLGDEQAARDVSQETFIQAWQHFDTLRDPGAARGWLYRIATNLALRHVERRRARPTAELPDDWPGMSDPGRRIAERDRVQQVLGLLTPKQRSALVLHEVHGFACDEIAQLLGLSRDAVKMALWRGREQFRLHYLREDDV